MHSEKYMDAATSKTQRLTHKASCTGPRSFILCHQVLASDPFVTKRFEDAALPTPQGCNRVTAAQKVGSGAGLLTGRLEVTEITTTELHYSYAASSATFSVPEMIQSQRWTSGYSND